MTSNYIYHTAHNSFVYRRRVPKKLIPYLNRSSVKLSIGQQFDLAKEKAFRISLAFDESLILIPVNMPEEVKSTLISSKLNAVGINCTAINATVIVPSWSNIVQSHLKSLSVSSNELRDQHYFLLNVMPAILKAILKNDNPKVETLNYDKLLAIRELLLQLPKRNIQFYRDMTANALVKQIDQSTILIPKDALISTRTINKYLKWIRAVLSFSYKRGIIKNNPSEGLTLPTKQTQRNQRKALSICEINILLDAIQDKSLHLLIKVLFYTGMRRSELYKCQITTINEILCFDLREPSSALKTQSSYRIIPIHSNLQRSVGEFEVVRHIFSGDYLGKYMSSLIKRTLDDPENKSLHSLRHSFATELICNDVQSDVVSELMGHQHHTMTLSRYAKGYPIKTLKDAIEKLPKFES